MPLYEIESTGEVTERYLVDAESEEAARLMFDMGELPQPFFSEVVSAEIVSVEDSERGRLRRRQS